MPGLERCDCRTHRRPQGHTGGDLLELLAITITPFTLVLDLHGLNIPVTTPSCAIAFTACAPAPRLGGEGSTMTLITTGMVLALLIPIALLCRQCNAWERLPLGSIGTRWRCSPWWWR